jgi:predicted amidohydrolase
VQSNMQGRIKNKMKICIAQTKPTKGDISANIEAHKDFVEKGIGQVIIKTDDTNIAPAICYESLQPTHAENAFKLGADVYLASVAKSESGVKSAFKHYPEVAKQYSMAVLMANCVGFCDNFLSVGKSSVWSKNGKLVGQLDDKAEGILIFDTETEEVTQFQKEPMIFFKTQDDFREWLESHHETETELIVGFYKVDSGKPSVSWSQSVDQALCFGGSME